MLQKFQFKEKTKNSQWQSCKSNQLLSELLSLPLLDNLFVFMHWKNTEIQRGRFVNKIMHRFQRDFHKVINFSVKLLKF